MIMTGSAEGLPVGEMVEVIGTGRSLDRVKYGLKVIWDPQIENYSNLVQHLMKLS